MRFFAGAGSGSAAGAFFVVAFLAALVAAGLAVEAVVTAGPLLAASTRLERLASGGFTTSAGDSLVGVSVAAVRGVRRPMALRAAVAAWVARDFVVERAMVGPPREPAHVV